MKARNQKESISTVPDGVWESSDPGKRDKTQKTNPAEDLQKNGYPDKKPQK